MSTYVGWEEQTEDTQDIHHHAPTIVSDMLHNFDIEEFVLLWMTFVVEFIVIGQEYVDVGKPSSAICLQHR